MRPMLAVVTVFSSLVLPVKLVLVVCVALFHFVVIYLLQIESSLIIHN
jgi:hypothetical protein